MKAKPIELEQWKILDHGDGPLIYSKDGAKVATLEGYPQSRLRRARLMIAAPDLLKAAKAMEQHLMNIGWSTSVELDALSNLSKAIAKAEDKD